jgi:hypothetical protein
MTRRTHHARQLTEFIATHELSTKPPPVFIDESFTAQAAFIRDPARQKAALCTRRAGKSYGVALYLYKEAYETAGVQCLYVALTRPSAKAIMWPILQKINRLLGLNAKPHNGDLTMTLPNGSIIRLTGADATREQMERQLGQANKLVAVDECASFKPHIKKLIYEVLRPTLVDFRGSLVLIGTPGDVPAGLFFDVTTGVEPGWSVHQWTTYDNPHMEENWTKEMDELRAMNPLIEETPTFRRNYLGEWVVESDNLVYRFNATRNLFTTLPAGHYTYLLGVDMGWEDPTAMVLGAYSEHDTSFYILHVWKKKHALLSEVAEVMRDYIAAYDIAHVVIDDASKQAVEDMRIRYQINMEAAEKSGKTDFVGIMNDDFILGNIKLCTDNTDDLIEEYSNLIWHENALGKRAEDPRCQNHATDAALYAYRYAKHYLADPLAPKIRPGDEGWSQLEEDKMWEEACEFDENEEQNTWWDCL